MKFYIQAIFNPNNTTDHLNFSDMRHIKKNLDFISKNLNDLNTMNLNQCDKLFGNYFLVKKLLQIPDFTHYIRFNMICGGNNYDFSINNYIYFASCMKNINDIDICGMNLIEALMGYENTETVKRILDMGFDATRAPYLLYARDSPINILDTIIESDVFSSVNKYHQQDTFLAIGDKVVTKIKEIDTRTMVGAYRRFVEALNIDKLIRSGIKVNNVTKYVDVIKSNIDNTGIYKYYLCLTLDKFDGEINQSDSKDWENILVQCSKFLDSIHCKSKLIHGDIKPENILKRHTVSGMEYIPCDYETLGTANCFDIKYKMYFGSYYHSIKSYKDDNTCLIFSMILLFIDFDQIVNIVEDIITKHNIKGDVMWPIVENYRDIFVMSSTTIPLKLKHMFHKNRMINHKSQIDLSNYSYKLLLRERNYELSRLLSPSKILYLSMNDEPDDVYPNIFSYIEHKHMVTKSELRELIAIHDRSESVELVKKLYEIFLKSENEYNMMISSYYI